ncbi:hypothetical protein F5H01DRAFT_357967 [Linnemannia elongata]|nr:hypothetical protein F5H01DRAFT_357967 [Linnemannia elongata]
MSVKLASLLLMTLVVLQIFMSSSINAQAEAVKFPTWCICGNDKTKTEILCKFAAANWDGGSCGLDNQRAYNSFVTACKQNGGESCWN